MGATGGTASALQSPPSRSGFGGVRGAHPTLLWRLTHPLDRQGGGGAVPQGIQEKAGGDFPRTCPPGRGAGTAANHSEAAGYLSPQAQRSSRTPSLSDEVLEWGPSVTGTEPQARPRPVRTACASCDVLCFLASLSHSGPGPSHHTPTPAGLFSMARLALNLALFIATARIPDAVSASSASLVRGKAPLPAPNSTNWQLGATRSPRPRSRPPAPPRAPSSLRRRPSSSPPPIRAAASSPGTPAPRRAPSIATPAPTCGSSTTPLAAPRAPSRQWGASTGRPATRTGRSTATRPPGARRLAR